MSLRELVEECYEAFQTYSADAQVVLLHPESRLRSMLVAHLLNEAPYPIYYYAIGTDDIDLTAFLEGFTHDLANQHPTFGSNLYKQNWRDYDNQDFDKLVDALVQDLNEISPEPFLLILDEFDASNQSELIQVFWERVVRDLPPQCQLVINSRVIPRMPWVSMIARGQALVLKDNELVRDEFYKRPKHGEEAHIDAIGLGPGSVTINGYTIEEWEGHLPRLLLFFVLDRPLVTRAEICRTFWPDLDSDQAVNVFHVTKRRLHKALEFDVLVHEDGYYRISPEATVTYDVEAYVTNLLDGRLAGSLKDGMPYYQAVADSYLGPFLQGHTESWIVERREDFLAGYLEAMSALAGARLEEGRQEQALNLLLRAVTENELHEPIHQEIMRLYSSLGRRSEAAAHFKKVSAVMNDHGRELSDETRDLYEEIIS
jgi:DNA-binding SARP family transcriptional activator